MTKQEIPVVFDCEGSELIGMIHVPEEIRTRGMIAIVAGGPQYRGGIGRLQVQFARELSSAGIPVMRFDYRGLGDSEGSFRGFQSIEADIAAAIKTFHKHLPQVREVVLWGGCDAASAIMINANKFPEVTGIILGNPWVHTDETSDAVTVKHHYSKRIREKGFWLKVLRLQYNPIPALATITRTLLKKCHKLVGHSTKQEHSEPDSPSRPFIARMRNGLSRYKGDMLLLMSGRSIVSKEFDELLDTQPAWQKAIKSPRLVVRLNMPNADQTFSSVASRAAVTAVTRKWMLDPQTPLSDTIENSPTGTAS